MDIETIVKDLERCLNADCQECTHAERKSVLTCGELLKDALLKLREYEGMVKRRAELLDK